jgi:cell division protein ZapA
MKQLEVQIMQQSYLLGCPEGREARLLDAVERVDTAMTRIRDAGKVRARERIAVLAALNLAFELADREAAELAAAAHIPPLSAAAPMGTTGTVAAMPPQSTERLQALVQRIDDVLGSDGHLL